MSRRANVYIAIVVALGTASLLHGTLVWNIDNWPRFLTWCALAMAASRLKVSLPGVTGTVSINFVFVLLGVCEVGLAGTQVMGCLGMLMQCLVFTKARPRPIQVAFSVASMATSVEACYWAWRFLPETSAIEQPVRLLCAAAAFFAANTLQVAIVIALTEGQKVFQLWRGSYFWTFPNYLAGAAMAWAMDRTGRSFGWEASLLLLPVLYVVYRSHNLYVTRLDEARKRAEEQRAHAQQFAALQRRTVETLALAVEAKDLNTRQHLERVENYAVDVGREFGLPEDDLDALRAAALLHDVGKIAVPEYIVSKPGRLTPEEFEKMKVHTVVGAQIVEQIRFPWPVAPIVRAHHEKWDGSGYPDGLAGEQIPLGARILAAVDCLDALTSDRQYRRALPRDEALSVIRSESGRSYDPRVVDVLTRRCVELGPLAGTGGGIETQLATDMRVERGEAPAAGFQPVNEDLLSLRDAVAQSETRAELSMLLAAVAGDREATLAVVRRILPEVLPCAAMALYLRSDDHLTPAAVEGDRFRTCLACEMEVGEGLSGWVAESGQSILNGNPCVEPGYLRDPGAFGTLQSALAIPLETSTGILGVLALYRENRDAFTAADLALLRSIGAELAHSLEAVTGWAASPLPGTLCPNPLGQAVSPVPAALAQPADS